MKRGAQKIVFEWKTPNWCTKALQVALDYDISNPSNAWQNVFLLTGVTGALIGGYKTGKGEKYDRKVAVIAGCVFGGVVGSMGLWLWPLTIPAYAIYKVAEVASRD